MERYTKMYNDYKNCNITRLEWLNYCEEVLTELMEENSATLHRLKDDGYPDPPTIGEVRGWNDYPIGFN